MSNVRLRLSAELGKMPQVVQDSTLAASALALAGVIDGYDEAETGKRDAVAAAKELRAYLADLHELASRVPEERDPVDELQSAGPARLSGTVVPLRPAGSG
jgi:hypothetical protein